MFVSSVPSTLRLLQFLAGFPVPASSSALHQSFHAHLLQHGSGCIAQPLFQIPPSLLFVGNLQTTAG